MHWACTPTAEHKITTTHNTYKTINEDSLQELTLNLKADGANLRPSETVLGDTLVHPGHFSGDLGDCVAAARVLGLARGQQAHLTK